MRIDRLFEIFIKLIKVMIIYKLYNIYSVESLKRCDFSYSSLKMMSILIQQRMPVIMLIKNDEYIDTTKNASHHAIFLNYEELLMNFIWEKGLFIS